jgi:hypothetical protein
MTKFIFYTSIGVEAEDQNSAVQWFDYQMGLTQLNNDIYVEEILGDYNG